MKDRQVLDTGCWVLDIQHSASSIRHRLRPAFTLVELLVVVAIIAVLASLLLPALQNAREQGKRAACLGNMRQIEHALLMYADDNGGWFPPVNYETADIFNALAMSGSMGNGSGWCWDDSGPPNYRPTWMPHYFPSIRVLRCPGADNSITENASIWYYLPSYVNTIYWSSYRILAATSEWPNVYQWTFYGWGLQTSGATPGGQYRAPCPSINFLGRSITGYGAGGDYWGPVYIFPAAEQPAVLDSYDPSGRWYDMELTPHLNNHSRLKGENVVFIDGHGEWKTASAVTNRFCPNWSSLWVYW